MAVRRGSFQPSTYLSFDGAANSYVALAATNVLPDATASFSGAAWVRRAPFGAGSTDGIAVIIGNRRDSTTAGWVFKIANKAQTKVEVTFFDQNNSSQGEISTVTVPSDRWTEVGFSFDGRTSIFYIDGNKDQKSTLATPKTVTEYTGQNLRIGHRQAAGSTFETFSGQMADLRIWNRVLTDAEFADMYSQQRVPTANLRARWAMNDGAGTTVTDSVGGFTGTITGGVTWATAGLDLGRSNVGRLGL